MKKFYIYYFDTEICEPKLLKENNKTLFFNSFNDAKNYIYKNYNDNVSLYVLKFIESQNKNLFEGEAVLQIFKENGKIISY